MIKKFENFQEERIYKIGDYILYNNDGRWDIEPECKIIDIHDNKVYDKLSDDYDIYPEYQIKPYINDFFETNFWIKKHQIIRKLTPEEIEEYKIKESQRKYNL